MATRTISNIILNTAANTASVSLASGDTLNLLQYGFIYSVGVNSEGVLAAGSNILNIDGTIFAMQAFGLSTTLGANTINITAAATIFGQSAGLAIAGNGNLVKNAGDIGSQFLAVAFDGAGNNFSNSGAVISVTNGAIAFAGGNSTFNNSGYVATSDANLAVQFSGTTNTIINSGTITAGAAISATGATGIDALFNTGSIIGTSSNGWGFLGGDAVNNVTNNGVIQAPILAIGLGRGDDTYDGRNGKAIGAISGGEGNDTIYGGKDADSIFGDDGADVIIGGPGGDVIRGGLGADRFVFNAGDNGDLIQNFNEGGVRDKIDLRGYFDAVGFTGADPRPSGLMQVLQNGNDTDIYLSGAFVMRIEGVVAAALDNSYFLIQ